ncbi:sorting nexin-18-like protein [Lates japonicus]|uniref:Sorting nexin-18-like protein n=1 Tax=Lates japonicus TaxID=270547 RepID=A0AAD3MJN8_LATJO|nr:sorting nexin-18-like protein [Lates japonicus]
MSLDLQEVEQNRRLQDLHQEDGRGSRRREHHHQQDQPVSRWRGSGVSSGTVLQKTPGAIRAGPAGLLCGPEQGRQPTASEACEMGEYFAEQQRRTWIPFLTCWTLQDTWPTFLSIIHVQKGALTKVKDCPKQEGELHDRCNIISCATLAEIQHFHRTRVRDFRSQMQHHLRQQISFFQKITAKLEDALQRYDDEQ